MDARMESGFAQPVQPPARPERKGCLCCKRRSKRDALRERIELLKIENAEVTRKEQAAQAQLRIVRDQVTAVQMVTNEAKGRLQATHQQIRKAEAERRANIDLDHRSSKLQECKQRLLGSKELRASVKAKLDELKRKKAAADQDADSAREASARVAELDQEEQQLASRLAEAQGFTKRSDAQVEQLRQLQNALLERGSRDAERLGELKSQGEALAQELYRVHLDLETAKSGWSQIPYRESDIAAEIDRLRRKAIADEGRLETLRQELADVTTNVEAAKAARLVAEPCSRPRNADGVRSKVAAKPKAEDEQQEPRAEPIESPQSPPLPKTLLKAREPPQVFEPVETVLEVDPAPAITSPYTSPTLGREPAVFRSLEPGPLAEVEATNDALRQEIAALRERMEQRRLREEIAALRERVEPSLWQPPLL